MFRGGTLAADEVVDVDREAVRILEEVVGCRANVDAKCGGIKGQAICGAAEAGILKDLVGEMEEELLLHVHACTLALADAKVWLVKGRRASRRGGSHGGSCMHRG